MLRKSLLGLLLVLVVIVVYFLAWPVPVEPVAWKAPLNPGYTGPYARNDLLKAVEFLKIGANHGPEDVAVDDQGRIYVSAISLRLAPGSWLLSPCMKLHVAGVVSAARGQSLFFDQTCRDSGKRLG